jgi:pimeloyl-ACP methyl ester carboxylesterase
MDCSHLGWPAALVRQRLLRSNFGRAVIRSVLRKPEQKLDKHSAKGSLISVQSDTAAIRGVESFVEVKGSPVRLLTGGSGEPVLYLHGSGDQGAWLPVHEQLAQTYTVLRPDLPGFGHSAPLPGRTTVHDIAYSLWDLVDALGYGSIRVIGSSLGGWIAADFATIETPRVSHLVLVGAAGLRPEGGHGIDVFILSPEEILAKTYHSPAIREAVLSGAAARADDSDAALIGLRNRAATAGLAWNPYFHDVKLSGRLHRITAKTLLMWGDDDQLMSPACADLYASLIPGSTIQIVADCGHLPQLERPEEFLDAVSAFLGS